MCERTNWAFSAFLCGTSSVSCLTAKKEKAEAADVPHLVCFRHVYQLWGISQNTACRKEVSVCTRGSRAKFCLPIIRMRWLAVLVVLTSSLACVSDVGRLWNRRLSFQLWGPAMTSVEVASDVGMFTNRYSLGSSVHMKSIYAIFNHYNWIV